MASTKELLRRAVGGEEGIVSKVVENNIDKIWNDNQDKDCFEKLSRHIDQAYEEYLFNGGPAHLTLYDKDDSLEHHIFDFENGFSEHSRCHKVQIGDKLKTFCHTKSCLCFVCYEEHKRTYIADYMEAKAIQDQAQFLDGIYEKWLTTPSITRSHTLYGTGGDGTKAGLKDAEDPRSLNNFTTKDTFKNDSVKECDSVKKFHREERADNEHFTLPSIEGKDVSGFLGPEPCLSFDTKSEYLEWKRKNKLKRTVWVNIDEMCKVYEASEPPAWFFAEYSYSERQQSYNSTEGVTVAGRPT